MNDAGKSISEIRKTMGDKLLVLAHHYQRSSVFKHADEVGDSLELARKTAEYPKAEKIVFCGVQFMAESADVLSAQSQTVYMPDIAAGCPMSNMAKVEDADRAWDFLESQGGGNWVPVVYVNSSAEIKAFCGKHGGSTCTSSNADRVFQWVFAQGKRVFFLPDEHLGANTAHDLDIPDDDVLLYDPNKDNGGLDSELVRRARVVVWKGFCIVHQSFTVEAVQQVREKLPTAKIIIHPEAPKEVVRLCDAHGSTSKIIDYVESAQDGSVIVVGTEMNLVQRLAEKNRGRVSVKALTPSVCANMAKSNEQNLLEVLESFPVSREIHVPSEIANNARKSLETMLSL